VGVKARPQYEKRHARRALSEDEVKRLVASAEEDWLHVSILLALYTGLRLGEIRALLWSDVDLDGGELRIRPEIEKSRRGAVLPLHPVLKGELERQYKKTVPGPGSLVVANMVCKPIKPLREALARAKVVYRDETGRFADWHALRHTFLTNLVRSDADMKTIQSLGRHATAALTLGTYLHASRDREAAAVAGLPDFTEAPDGAAEQAAREGTTGAGTTSTSAQRAQKKDGGPNTEPEPALEKSANCLLSSGSRVRVLLPPPDY